MFEILDETEGDLVAIRVGRGTRQGYDELYSLLVQKTNEYGAVHVLEVVPDWTCSTFLSHLYGIIPDLRYGSQFTISRYAAVGDSVWAKLLFDWWKIIRPIWPVAPDQMRYFETEEQSTALQWLQTVNMD
ncbi:STAS/SEC14 domain-containing protein [Saliphagus infecundisoli]|uniref:STAS/SEC14 domain-containing protein n=1 Tax=Saliphagus infecundisoli TaxID=1849069 RepID=A0ABD5QAH6_9EURY|nr:STAS/SEC14 domain-containing protein [Saliphagus infecundisoli]